MRPRVFSLKVTRASRPARFVEAAESPDHGDAVAVTWIDRLARSTRDLLNTLAAITGKEAGFRSLSDV
jgi:DNA invertase Pin-like site-specific DNA recombinase